MLLHINCATGSFAFALLMLAFSLYRILFIHSVLLSIVDEGKEMMCTKMRNARRCKSRRCNCGTDSDLFVVIILSWKIVW